MRGRTTQWEDGPWNDWHVYTMVGWSLEETRVEKDVGMLMVPTMHLASRLHVRREFYSQSVGKIC